MEERLDDADDVLGRAVALAARLHRGQVEKSTGTPYVGHVMTVAATIMRAGGTTDQVVAGLLHDVIEDAGPQHWPDVAAFGPLVTQIVAACSDAQPRAAGKEPWLDRKVDHLAHLRAGVLPATDGVVAAGTPIPIETYLVVAADKLDAVTRTVAELRSTGAAVWDAGIFKGGRRGTVWYYRSMAEVVVAHLPDAPLARLLVERTAQMAALAGDLGAVPLDDLLEAAKVGGLPDGIRDGEGRTG